MITEHLRRTPYVVDHPEMYLGFNIKVQQNAFDILDNLMHEWGEKYKPTDEIIWSKVIIPQWNYYWNSSPQAGNASKRITVFPWYNSTLMKQQIANETDRKIALMYFWELLPKVADLDEWLDYKPPLIVHHKGLNAMIYTIEQMPRVYDEITKLYPNGTIPATRVRPDPMDPRYDFYGWITDRGLYGFENMQTQFLGFDREEGRKICESLPQFLIEFDKYVIQHYDGINTYLSKNFTHWDLIKFIYS